MAKYDPNVIQKFADRLYQQANTTVAIYTTIGFVLGAVAGGSVQVSHEFLVIAMGIGALIFGIIGLNLGTSRALTLRMQAQSALCQRQIEHNTRPRMQQHYTEIVP